MINILRPQKLIVILCLLTYYATSAQVKFSGIIGQRTLQLTDQARQRLLLTEVWYPTDDTLKKSDQGFSLFIRHYTVRNGRLSASRLPLILLSHGTGGGRLTMEWLAQGLAQNGFMVAAVDHWGNMYDNKIPLEFPKPWERPLDISYVLTTLLASKTIAPSIDPQRVGAIGFSFGGYTVLALSGATIDYRTLLTYYRSHRQELDVPELPNVSKYLDDPALTGGVRRVPPLKDSRINAFFSISPSMGQGFTSQAQFATVQDPVYIVGSENDQMSPVKANARKYHNLIAGSEYYEFEGKPGHYVMLNEAIDEVKKSDPTYFTDDPSVDRHQVHTKVIALAIEFFSTKLR